MPEHMHQARSRAKPGEYAKRGENEALKNALARVRFARFFSESKNFEILKVAHSERPTQSRGYT